MPVRCKKRAGDREAPKAVPAAFPQAGHGLRHLHVRAQRGASSTRRQQQAVCSKIVVNNRRNGEACCCCLSSAEKALFPNVFLPFPTPAVSVFFRPPASCDLAASRCRATTPSTTKMKTQIGHGRLTTTQTCKAMRQDQSSLTSLSKLETPRSSSSPAARTASSRSGQWWRVV